MKTEKEKGRTLYVGHLIPSRCDVWHVYARSGGSCSDKRSPSGAANQSDLTMMSYTFIPSLIYNAGEVAAAWAVVALLFGLLAFA